MARTGIPQQKIDFIVIDLWEQGYDDHEIAKEINRSLNTVKRIREQLGYKKDFPITKNWLDRSGVGRKWDKTCERFKNDGTEA